MIALLALGFGFVAGMLAEQHKAKLGAVGGAVRDAVLGARPRPTRAGPAIRTVLKNVSNFVGALWRWKWAILALLFFSLALGLARGCVDISLPDWGKSRDTIIAERNNANENTDVAEHETDLSNHATELADNTNTDVRRVDAIVVEADREIEDAVSQNDFDSLFAAYDRAYRSVWNDTIPEDRSDPSARRLEDLPSLGAGPI